MKAVLRKVGISAWISVGVAVLALVSVILYKVNCNAPGVFKDHTAKNVVLFAVLAIIFSLASIGAYFVPEGKVADIVRVVATVLKVAAVVLIFVSFFSILSTRVEGFGYVYFSNEEVIKDVQSPANMASAKGAIAALVLYAITGVGAIVNAFFPVTK